MPFLDPLIVKVLSDGDVVLIKRFRYRRPNSSQVLSIPIGFVSDYASIPRVFRGLVSGSDNTKLPSVLHDYLYRKGIGKRKWADQLFLDAMKESGVPWLKRRMVYSAVRVGGWASWKGN